MVKGYILRHKREVAIGSMLLFFTSLSFGLGYAAARQFDHVPIIIEKCSR